MSLFEEQRCPEGQPGPSPRPLPQPGWELILADPPWAYDNGGCHGGIEAQYPSLTLPQLAAMPVSAYSESLAVLLMWATWPRLTDAIALIDFWGFTLKTGLPWVKTYDGFRPVNGLGYWVRGCSEPLLIATRGNVQPPEPSTRKRGLLGLPAEWSQLDLLITAPRGGHSEKPPEAHILATALAPWAKRRVELFARREVPGWECWGNEV